MDDERNLSASMVVPKSGSKGRSDARKSPEARARDGKVGKRARGLDGRMWTIIETRSGVHRWSPDAPKPEKKAAAPKTSGEREHRGRQRRGKEERDRMTGDDRRLDPIALSTIFPVAGTHPNSPLARPALVRPKTYFTHDNRGKAFMVRFDSSRFEVFAPKDDECLWHLPAPKKRSVFVTLRGLVWAVRGLSDPSEDVVETGGYSSEKMLALKECFTRLVFASPYDRVFVGKSEESRAHGSRYDGNTVLFDIGSGEYVCVSETVAKFSPGQRIVRYESPIYDGKVDVSYPYAVGETRVFLTSGVGPNIWIDRSELERAQTSSEGRRPRVDPYDYAFGTQCGTSTGSCAAERKRLLSKFLFPRYTVVCNRGS